MATPIYDKLRGDFDEAIKSAEFRGRNEYRLHLIKELKLIKKPTGQVRDLIKNLEAENA